MYGTLDVSWQSGFPEGRVLAGFVEGSVVPASGSITIPHGVEEKNFTIEVHSLYPYILYHLILFPFCLISMTH